MLFHNSMMGQLEDTSYSAILYVNQATVAMVTKEKDFLDYHSNRCYDENFLHLFHRALYYFFFQHLEIMLSRGKMLQIFH